MMSLDREDLKDIVCGHYTAAEIVEVLGLSSEDLFDELEELILSNLEEFELVQFYLDRNHIHETFNEESYEKEEFVSEIIDEPYL